jgi:hypothetical protein
MFFISIIKLLFLVEKDEKSLANCKGKAKVGKMP